MAKYEPISLIRTARLGLLLPIFTLWPSEAKKSPLGYEFQRALINLAPRAGLEPATIRLTAERSTN
jgi:hypothetical protein